MIASRKVCGIVAGSGLLSFLIWMVWSAWLTGPVISDSWQSVGPAAFSQHPFDLKGAFLGDFDGYDKSWGHHWPGWALFMSLFTPWLKFHPITVFGIEAVLVGFAAWIVFKAGKKGFGWWAAVLSGLVLLDPEINVSLSMMRPEPLTGLLMVILAWAVVDGSGRYQEIILILLCAAALPLIHVLGVVAPPAVVGVAAAWYRFSPRAILGDRRAHGLLALSAGWVFGIICLATWFLGNADRLHQFKENLAAQRLSAHGIWNSFRACYLADIGGGMMFLLWLALAWIAILFIRRPTRNLRGLLLAAMPVAAVLFSILAHNPNRLHLAAVVPCALLACGAGGEITPDRLVRRSRLALIPVMGFALAFHLNRAAKVIQTRGVCPRPSLVELLKRHQGQGRLYIPLSLWEAAATIPVPDALFYTFPNVSAPEYRASAERSLFAMAKPGDRLIFDVTQNHANNDYFDREAFVHLTNVDVDSLGPVIEVCEVEGMSGSRLYHVIRIIRPPFTK